MISTTDETGQQIIDGKKRLKAFEWLPIWGILMLVALIYSPVIINAFNGDDFVHLSWLAQAVHQPELVWRNFHSPWLDITTAKFYRPLVSLFMLGDYVIGKGNGIAFHLTNLLSHLANTCLLWLILKQLAIKNNSQHLNYIWCVGSAALFGLYPLHPEAVSWITGRVDTFVTLFFLLSVLFYMYWQGSAPQGGLKSRKSKWLFLSLVSMGLALLCKEMAIILPAVFFVYEFIVSARPANDKPSVFANVVSIVIKTSPFWTLLFLYLILRYYALGTVIGGYDNTLFSFDNWRVLLSNWRRSVYFLCFPFSEAVLDKRSPVIYLWGVLLLINVFLIIKQVFWERKNIATFLFLVGWLLLSLVPVCKLFNISTDLQGSRLAYLATVPLSALLCFGYSNKISYWRITGLIIMLSTAGAALLVNNSAWLKAELTSQAIVGELNKLSKTVVPDSVVYIVGLPDQIQGAYVCRNALDGMSKYPQISKDIRYCFNLNEINHVFPFGYARQSMVDVNSNSQPCQIFVWNGLEQKLSRFSLQREKALNEQIATIQSIDTLNDVSIHDAEVLVNLKERDCFDLDCLIFTIDFKQCDDQKKSPKNCSLYYTNDLCPQFDSVHRLDASCASLNGENTFVFPLHGQVDWAMGGKAHSLKLVLPKSNKIEVKNISFYPIDIVMPALTFQPNGNQNVLGFIELNKTYPSCQLHYDGRKVFGAKKIKLELSPPDQTFAVANDVKVTPLLKELTGLTGLLSLNRKDFACSGIYEVRVRAFTENNDPIGIAGDHMVVTVK